MQTEELSTPLSDIFTKSIIQGRLPQNWKDAIVTPLHEKGEESLQVIVAQLV